MAQEKKDKVKIEAPLDNIVELVKGAFDGSPSPAETDAAVQLPKNLPASQLETVNSNPPVGNDTQAQLRAALSAPPLQSEHKPSGMRRFGGAIAGGLVGAGFGPEEGMKVSQGIVDKPYRESYQDWATKTGALEKQASLDIEQKKADTSGLSAYGSYLRSIGAIDPEVQGAIEGAKTGARETALQPGRESLEDKRQAGRTALEDIRRQREQDLETVRQLGRESLEGTRQANRTAISDKDRAAREKTAKDQINSRENIAKLNRDLRKNLAASATKNQRVPPSQQYLGKLMAENEISQLVSDPDEFEALFNTNTDKTSGKVTYTLKPDKEVKSTWKKKRDERQADIDKLLGSILKTSYSPTADNADDEETGDSFDIEEIE